MADYIGTEALDGNLTGAVNGQTLRSNAKALRSSSHSSMRPARPPP